MFSQPLDLLLQSKKPWSSRVRWTNSSQLPVKKKSFSRDAVFVACNTLAPSDKFGRLCSWFYVHTRQPPVIIIIPIHATQEGEKNRKKRQENTQAQKPASDDSKSGDPPCTALAHYATPLPRPCFR
ncbi:hypothetical protein D8B26_004380 [Coccidioides posadasii str. Silveira]|uniref:uncharacterized protein n=1 Tax=Coccidioides posadasii (strain RMSCC 757 / Silveira) TaxID=443226 RepID=UPI001BEF768F|nr:hypothetical protein D8B26_004380 [Coccidioides posadasii str. Silveira]